MKRIKSVLNKSFCLVLVAALFVCSIPYKVYASPWNNQSWQDDCLDILTILGQSVGLMSGVIHGNATDTIQGFAEFYLEIKGTETMTFQEYFESHYHPQQDNSISLDPELYNFIMEYFEHIVNNGDAVQVSYKNLYVPSFDYVFNKERGGSKTFSSMTKTNRAIFDLRRYTFKDGYINKVSCKVALNHWKAEYYDLKSQGFQSDLLSGYKLSGFYHLYTPVTGWNNPHLVSESRSKIGNFKICEHMIPDQVDQFYFVGQFNNNTNHTYVLDMYYYDQVNDRVVLINGNTLSCSMDVYDQITSSGYEVTFAALNHGREQHAVAPPSFNVDQRYPNDFTGKVTDMWRYNSTKDAYFIPLLRSDNPGYYKVFKDREDLLRYCRNLNGTHTTNNYNFDRSITNVIIKGDTISYNYYFPDEDPNNEDDPGDEDDPDDEDEPGGSSSGSDYNLQLQYIINLLQEISMKIDDIEGGGSSSQNATDLTLLYQKLNDIKASIERNQNYWSETDVSSLLNAINSLLNDLDAIVSTLETISGYEIENNGVLNSILYYVRSIDSKMFLKKKIKDTEDDLDDLLRFIQKLIEQAGGELSQDIIDMLGLKFPFSVPYILVLILDNLCAPAEAPKFTIPFEFAALNVDESITIDFSDFSEAAEVIRFWMKFIWIMGLIKITPKMIDLGKEVQS